MALAMTNVDHPLMRFKAAVLSHLDSREFVVRDDEALCCALAAVFATKGTESHAPGEVLRAWNDLTAILGPYLEGSQSDAETPVAAVERATARLAAAPPTLTASEAIRGPAGPRAA